MGPKDAGGSCPVGRGAPARGRLRIHTVEELGLNATSSDSMEDMLLRVREASDGARRSGATGARHVLISCFTRVPLQSGSFRFRRGCLLAS